MRFCMCILGLLLASSSFAADEKWKLIWGDEFDYKGAPDPKKWDYEEGFVRNKEPQYYTKDRRENARVEDGMLIIEGRKETFANPKYDPEGKDFKTQTKEAQYTSASLITLNKQSFKYGRFVARAKVTNAHGTWPAFWMMGINRSEVKWPNCGEIDIMEFFSQRPTLVKGTVIYPASGKVKAISKDVKPDIAPADDFHTYEIRWYPDRIDFYLDDKQYHSVPLDPAGDGDNNPFRKEHYMLLNLALGSSTGKIDDTSMPQKYLIDYVRVYALEK